MFIENISTDSAIYRHRNPKSWPWTVDTDLLSAILFTLQGANWQRSGGRGDKPTLIERPVEKRPTIDEAVPVVDRLAALDDEIARRRATKNSKSKRPIGGVRVG